MSIRTPEATGPARLRVDSATLGYDKRIISERLSVDIPNESFTVIVGPNACGKSTLLRGMSRLVKPSAGQVVLDGADINSYKTKEVARRVGLLPRAPSPPTASPSPTWWHGAGTRTRGSSGSGPRKTNER